MSIDISIREGQILNGPMFNEPMRVETISSNGPSIWVVGLVGQQSEQFRRVTLRSNDISNLSIVDSSISYNGNGQLLRIGLQAYSLGIAYEFDPYFGLSISRVDPLPHQLEAVYEHIMRLPNVRFLLADDAGAGKTIMAGLLIRELKLRGLIERVLIVCPANLSFQWQRELREKFDEKFLVFKGSDIRDQFGINQWMEQKQIITSLDLAKRPEILRGLRQVHWDLVIVDEAHRMSARDESHKSQRYRLGEVLRDSTDNILLLTATPHKGDPHNFTLFLQLLDKDVYADVKSIQEAMDQSRAPFYLRRTKEAMVCFPERQTDGTWATKPVFTKRITRTAGFSIDGPEFDLYQKITRFVKQQSERAMAEDNNPRARAVGFLMSLYQRRLASSTYAMRRSLENRAKRLEEGLERAQHLVQETYSELPSIEELEEFEDHERERLEAILAAITLSNNKERVSEEVSQLLDLAEEAKKVENSGSEAKLEHLRKILQDEGFFDCQDQRLLLFTEFRDTLEYLVGGLAEWGFSVGYIHGGMKPGSRDEQGTRLYTEQQFREGNIQILVATEAAGEGINLQCCHILFNYDIPWNPNRLEQRMGRIHRYGQRHDCLIFNFVATNTIEGRVLQRLLEKLQEIRDALDDDAVFNVIGEILPSAHVERVLRDYYAGRLGEIDLEDRLLKNVDESHFRDICRTALEGLATKKLNLNMLIERRAQAQKRRVVPETIARFIKESAQNASLTLEPVSSLTHTFEPGPTPSTLKKYEKEANWKLPELAIRYPRLSTDRDTAEKNNLEWVIPGHPLFEALRRHALDISQESFIKGSCFYSLEHEIPARLDFYRVRVVDGIGNIIREQLFTLELTEGAFPLLRELDVLGNLIPADVSDKLPVVAELPEETAWLNENALAPFIEEVRADRLAEIDRIGQHVDLSLTEVLQRIDEEIGRAAYEVQEGAIGAEGRLTIAESRYAQVQNRREHRREELNQQRAMTLQGVQRLASVIILPHPDRNTLDIKRLQPNPETEKTAMLEVVKYETAQGRKVEDVHEKNLGYDLTSLDPQSGELRLIEVKGLAGATGSVLLTPNEHRLAEDRPDCFWLYVVTNCASVPEIQTPIKDPAQFSWNEVVKVQHYWLDINTMTKPMKRG